MKIGIIGNGFVGQATKILECKNNEIFIYDIDPKKCYPSSLNFKDLKNTDIIFVCVPTPMEKSGKCHTAIVEKVIKDLYSLKGTFDIIIKSTVPPGTCEKLNVNFMPEFLTEKNWKEDFKNEHEWILGTKDPRVIKKIQKIFTNAKQQNRIYNDTLIVVTSKEAEMIKYFKNTYLAVKLSFCNEIYDFCQVNGINYNVISSISCKDKRITNSHTNVPGHDGKRGYGGTCFPKDIASLNYEFEKNNLKSYILDASQRRNNQQDRPEMDWCTDNGRAVV